MKMDKVWNHILTNPIDEKYLKTILPEFISQMSRSPRDVYSQVFARIGTVSSNLLTGFNLTDNEYLYTPPLRVFLEILCFLSSIDISINDLKQKKVLFIGSGSGVEVVILRMLGIQAFGIEKDEKLQNISKEISKQLEINESVFVLNNIENYSVSSKEKYDVIIARNLNPLSNVEQVVKNIPSVMNPDAVALIQWDALYSEDIALLLYSPKKKIYYNEKLRDLLDDLHIYVLKIKKPRARFLYKIYN